MFEAETLAAVRRTFQEMFDSGSAPCIVYGIVAGGELVVCEGFGDTEGGSPGASSVFRIASMTKSFTAAAVLALRDEDVLALDAPIETFVPVPSSALVGTPVTLRMLLTMSGGLPSDDPWADRQESMTDDEFEALLGRGLMFSSVPGTQFEYSNLGYAIVGRAVASVAGTSIHRFVGDRFLEPLGLVSTSFSSTAAAESGHLVTGHRRRGEEWVPLPFDTPGAFSSIGGLYSSVADIATWMGGFVDAFAVESANTHPLAAASRREMQQLHRFNAVTLPEPGRPTATGYGFGLAVEHTPRWGTVVGHSGGYPGFGSHMRWHPPSGIGVIAFGNATYWPARIPAAAALELLLAERRPPARRLEAWPRLDELRRAASRLIAEWDDAVADEIFAVNVDLDQPRDERRAEIEGLRARVGAVVGESDVRSISATDVDWTIDGETGRLDVEMGVCPGPDVLIQSLDISFVGPVSNAMENVVDTIVELSDQAITDRRCVRWESEHAAGYRLRSAFAEWRLEVAVNPDSGELERCEVHAVPPSIERWTEVLPSGAVGAR